MKYTDQQITEAVKASDCIMAVLRNLGIRETGGSHSHIKRRIAKIGLDISHFKKHQHFLKPGINRLTWDKVLVKRTHGGRKDALIIRRSLIESGREYKCEICNNDGTWNNTLLILEVDHKNNDWLDNRAENLRFVCPNCHQQQKHKNNKGFTSITTRSYKKHGPVGELADPLVLEANSEKSASASLAGATCGQSHYSTVDDEYIPMLFNENLNDQPQKRDNCISTGILRSSSDSDRKSA